MSLSTEYEFVLPRGYLDDRGVLHRRGTMRLATARDELAPLRDPIVTGPDDPRITILVLTRVVISLGTLEMVTTFEIEGLFAADLAFLQDFYGVINFGTQEEYEALIAAMHDSPAPPVPGRTGPVPVHMPNADNENASASEAMDAPDDTPRVRSSVERIGSRRQAVEDVRAAER